MAGKNLLRDYLNTRVKAAQKGKAEIQQGVVLSEELQGQIWAQAVVATKETPGSIPTGLFIQSLNKMIDIHLKRLTVGARNRVHASIWVTLYFLTALAMSMMGYRSGLVDVRSLLVSPALVLSFSGVMFLIADLDRLQQGFVQVSQQAMVELQYKFSKDKVPSVSGHKQSNQ
jgi:hypothetical protein